MNEATWSLGTMIWMPVAVLLVLALVIGGVLLIRADVKDHYSTGDAFLLDVVCPAIAAGLVIGTAWGMYPYSAEYHQYRPVTGTVEQIDSRVISTGDGMETKFVAWIDGEAYGCDDTRCASVREGDTLSLSCKRTWQFTGVDGYDCRFFSLEKADG